MRNLIYCFLIFHSVSLHAETTKAWWVEYSHEPSNTSVLGVAAAKINKDFEFIDILSCDNDSTFTDEQCTDINKAGMSLKVKGDFNKDGLEEIWYTGVAKSFKGEYFKVAFIVNSKGELNQSFYESHKSPGFSVLLKRDEKIAWAMCMYCGHLAWFKWDAGRWNLN